MALKNTKGHRGEGIIFSVADETLEYFKARPRKRIGFAYASEATKILLSL